MRRLIVISAALALAALAAPGAQAAPEWRSGTTETSYVGDCQFNLQPGIQANAQLHADTAAIPRVGDVFYVRSVIGRIGEGCGIYMGAHVEIVPPPGVTPAIDGAHPVRCQWMDIDSGALTPAAGCPQGIYEGVYGPAFDQLTPGGPSETYPWEIQYGKALVIEVPLRSSRPLHGTNPTCGRSEGLPPCLPASSGDTLQFTARMLDGWSSQWLTPYVPLFVEPGPGGSAGGGGSQGGANGGPGAGGGGGGKGGKATPLATAPRSLSLRRLLRGLPVAISVGKARSKVTAELTASGVRMSRRRAVIARRTVKRAKAGTLRMRLKPSRKAARALRRHRSRRPIRLVLRVRVTPPRGRAVRFTKRVTVRR